MAAFSKIGEAKTIANFRSSFYKIFAQLAARQIGDFVNVDQDLIEGYLNKTITELPQPICCLEEGLDKFFPEFQRYLDSLIAGLKLIC